MSTPIKPQALSAGLVNVKVQPQDAAPAAGPVRSMSIKVDDARYRRLKLLGLERNKSSQVLLLEAIDLLLARG